MKCQNFDEKMTKWLDLLGFSVVKVSQWLKNEEGTFFPSGRIVNQFMLNLKNQLL
jgi:hypothetical protein